MRKTDLRWIERRIGILTARIANTSPNASFYQELISERNALQRILEKLKTNNYE